MILWTANLGRGVTVNRFVLNWRRLLAAAGPRAVICLQEVDEADKPEEWDIITSGIRRTHTVATGPTAVPILVPNHLDIVEWNLELACKGLALITPHRVVNEVTLRLGKDLDVGILNTHLPRHVPPLTNSRREDVRQTLRQQARNHANGAWVADTNTRKRFPTMVPGEVTVIDGGIDQGKAWADDGRVLEIGRARTLDLTIDGHDAYGRRLWWRRAAA